MPTKKQILPSGIPPSEIITVLVVSPFAEDESDLLRIFDHPEWHVERVDDCCQARLRLMELAPSVVLSECSFPDGDWRDVLTLVQGMADPSNLVIASRHADEHLWAEVLNLGGYDVLAKPFDPAEVLRVIGMASRQFTGRRQRREQVRSAASGAFYLYGS